MTTRFISTSCLACLAAVVAFGCSGVNTGNDDDDDDLSNAIKSACVDECAKLMSFDCPEFFTDKDECVSSCTADYSSQPDQCRDELLAVSSCEVKLPDERFACVWNGVSVNFEPNCTAQEDAYSECIFHAKYGDDKNVSSDD